MLQLALLFLLFSRFSVDGLKSHLTYRISSRTSSLLARKTDQEMENKAFNPIYLLPIPLVMFGWMEEAHPAITTWIEPALLAPPATAWKYFLSGGISTSFSHAITVPFDVVKTRMQTSSSLGQLSIPKAFQEMVRTEGSSVLLTGMAPTVTGFFIHGSLKYGLYEIFKPLIKLWLLSEGFAVDKVVIFMLAALFAESIGCLALCPFEGTRIRMVAEPHFAPNDWEAAKKIYREDGLEGLYVGLLPLLLKHAPYSVCQLSTFEVISSQIYSTLAANGISGPEALHYQVAITAFSALVAAILGTFFSQPGDTILSAVNNHHSNHSSQQEGMIDTIVAEAKRVGWKGLFQGLQARLVHVASIVVVQLVVYDYIKQLCGVPATGFH
eukprot:gene3727-4076_t